MILNLLDYEDNSLNSNIYKFRTNAKGFKINFQVQNKIDGDYPHFAISAREGLMILYKFVDEENWYNLEAYARHENPIAPMYQIADGKRFYDVLIYGPNLTSLVELSIEIEDNFEAQIIDSASPRKMMFLGGKNSFGIGCTTSGVFFSNILQRMLDCEVKKFVYNTNDYLSYIHYSLMNEENIPDVDVAILEVDCINQNDKIVDNYLKDIIDILKEHCNHIICWLSVPDNEVYKKLKVEKLFESDEFITFVDLSCIYNDYNDMCIISNKYLNDSANIMIYKKLRNTISEVTNWNI